MNTETGHIHIGEAEIKAAQDRNEPLRMLPAQEAARILRRQLEEERAANRRFAERYMARESR